MFFLKIIDSHIHPIPAVLNPEGILQQMDGNDVEKAIILAMDLQESTLNNSKWKKYFENQLEFMIVDQEQIIDAMRFMLKNGHTSNEYVSKIQDKYPERLIGFGSVQLGYQKKSYITKKLNEIVKLGLKGIKLLPTLQFFNPAETKMLDELFKFADKHNLITLLHTGCDPGPFEFPLLSKNGNPELLYSTIKKFPDVTTILAHLGSYSAKFPAIWFKEAVSLFEKLPDHELFGDISAVPYLIENQSYLKIIKEKIGIKKILFGSDFPVTGSSLKELIDPIQNSDFLNQNEKNLILYNNIDAIFKSKGI